MSGPLFCVRTDVGAKGAGTHILARKFFSTNNSPPPHLSSQNDQRDVGIILSHRCWVYPPPPPARQVGRPEPPPSRHGGQGGGGGGWGNGLPCHPPPRRAIFFPPSSIGRRTWSFAPGAQSAFGGCAPCVICFLLSHIPPNPKPAPFPICHSTLPARTLFNRPLHLLPPHCPSFCAAPPSPPSPPRDDGRGCPCPVFCRTQLRPPHVAALQSAVPDLEAEGTAAKGRGEGLQRRIEQMETGLPERKVTPVAELACGCARDQPMTIPMKRSAGVPLRPTPTPKSRECWTGGHRTVHGHGGGLGLGCLFFVSGGQREAVGCRTVSRNGGNRRRCGLILSYPSTRPQALQTRSRRWGSDGLVTSVCQLRHDPMEQGPTEPHAGRSTFLLSSGGAGGAGITEWPLVRGRFLPRTSLPGRR